MKVKTIDVGRFAMVYYIKNLKKYFKAIIISRDELDTGFFTVYNIDKKLLTAAHVTQFKSLGRFVK